jgi:hypothetical protein
MSRDILYQGFLTTYLIFLEENNCIFLQKIRTRLRLQSVTIHKAKKISNLMLDDDLHVLFSCSAILLHLS